MWRLRQLSSPVTMAHTTRSSLRVDRLMRQSRILISPLPDPSCWACSLHTNVKRLQQQAQQIELNEDKTKLSSPFTSSFSSSATGSSSTSSEGANFSPASTAYPLRGRGRTSYSGPYRPPIANSSSGVNDWKSHISKVSVEFNNLVGLLRQERRNGAPDQEQEHEPSSSEIVSAQIRADLLTRYEDVHRTWSHIRAIQTRLKDAGAYVEPIDPTTLWEIVQMVSFYVPKSMFTLPEGVQPHFPPELNEQAPSSTSSSTTPSTATSPSSPDYSVRLWAPEPGPDYSFFFYATKANAPPSIVPFILDLRQELMKALPAALQHLRDLTLMDGEVQPPPTLNPKEINPPTPAAALTPALSTSESHSSSISSDTLPSSNDEIVAADISPLASTAEDDIIRLRPLNWDISTPASVRSLIESGQLELYRTTPRPFFNQRPTHRKRDHRTSLPFRPLSVWGHAYTRLAHATLRLGQRLHDIEWTFQTYEQLEEMVALLLEEDQRLKYLLSSWNEDAVSFPSDSPLAPATSSSLSSFLPQSPLPISVLQQLVYDHNRLRSILLQSIYSSMRLIQAHCLQFTPTTLTLKEQLERILRGDSHPRLQFSCSWMKRFWSTQRKLRLPLQLNDLAILATTVSSLQFEMIREMDRQLIPQTKLTINWLRSSTTYGTITSSSKSRSNFKNPHGYPDPPKPIPCVTIVDDYEDFTPHQEYQMLVEQRFPRALSRPLPPLVHSKSSLVQIKMPILSERHRVEVLKQWHFQQEIDSLTLILSQAKEHLVERLKHQLEEDLAYTTTTLDTTKPDKTNHLPQEAHQLLREMKGLLHPERQPLMQRSEDADYGHRRKKHQKHEFNLPDETKSSPLILRFLKAYLLACLRSGNAVQVAGTFELYAQCSLLPSYQFRSIGLQLFRDLAAEVGVLESFNDITVKMPNLHKLMDLMTCCAFVQQNWPLHDGLYRFLVETNSLIVSWAVRAQRERIRLLAMPPSPLLDSELAKITLLQLPWTEMRIQEILETAGKALMALHAIGFGSTYFHRAGARIEPGKRVFEAAPQQQQQQEQAISNRTPFLSSQTSPNPIHTPPLTKPNTNDSVSSSEPAPATATTAPAAIVAASFDSVKAGGWSPRQISRVQRYVLSETAKKESPNLCADLPPLVPPRPNAEFQPRLYTVQALKEWLIKAAAPTDEEAARGVPSSTPVVGSSPTGGVAVPKLVGWDPSGWEKDIFPVIRDGFEMWIMETWDAVAVFTLIQRALAQNIDLQPRAYFHAIERLMIEWEDSIEDGPDEEDDIPEINNSNSDWAMSSVAWLLLTMNEYQYPMPLPYLEWVCERLCARDTLASYFYLQALRQRFTANPNNIPTLSLYHSWLAAEVNKNYLLEGLVRRPHLCTLWPTAFMQWSRMRKDAKVEDPHASSPQLASELIKFSLDMPKASDPKLIESILLQVSRQWNDALEQSGVMPPSNGPSQSYLATPPSTTTIINYHNSHQYAYSSSITSSQPRALTSSTFHHWLRSIFTLNLEVIYGFFDEMRRHQIRPSISCFEIGLRACHQSSKGGYSSDLTPAAFANTRNAGYVVAALTKSNTTPTVTAKALHYGLLLYRDYLAHDYLPTLHVANMLLALHLQAGKYQQILSCFTPPSMSTSSSVTSSNLGSNLGFTFIGGDVRRVFSDSRDSAARCHAPTSPPYKPQWVTLSSPITIQDEIQVLQGALASLKLAPPKYVKGLRPTNEEFVNPKFNKTLLRQPFTKWLQYPFYLRPTNFTLTLLMESLSYFPASAGDIATFYRLLLQRQDLEDEIRVLEVQYYQENARKIGEQIAAGARPVTLPADDILPRTWKKQVYGKKEPQPSPATTTTPPTKNQRKPKRPPADNPNNSTQQTPPLPTKP